MMATPDQRDEALWAAIDSGTLEGPLADETTIAVMPEGPYVMAAVA